MLQSSSKTGVRASETAFPGPGSASPQPSSTTRQAHSTGRRSAPGGIVILRAPAQHASDDLGEGVRLKRRAADESAVDVIQRQQLGGVLRLHRPAVEDPHPLRRRSVAIADQRPDEADRFLRLIGRRRAAGADRPDRLIGDHDLRQPLVGNAREVLLHLLAQLAIGLVVVALGLRLANTQDRRQACSERSGHLGGEGPVGLAEVLPALGVTEHHALRAQPR